VIQNRSGISPACDDLLDRLAKEAKDLKL